MTNPINSQSDFPATRWSLVARAGRERSSAREKALDDLIQLYYPVLRRHLLMKFKFSTNDTEDLLHDFVLDKFLQNNLLLYAKSEHGFFRHFIRRALDNYVFDQIRRQKAQKRGPQAQGYLELNKIENLAAVDADLDKTFHLDWARQVLDEAIKRMRLECDSNGRSDLWRMFKLRVLDPILLDHPPIPYESLTSEFNLKSPSQAANLLLSGKRMFKRLLISVVRDTVSEENQIETELQDLERILNL